MLFRSQGMRPKVLGSLTAQITAIAKMQSGPNWTCSTDLRSHKYIQQTYQE